jgi:hypothetical protein
MGHPFGNKSRRLAVSDFALYWREYPNESGKHGDPVTEWNTNLDWLVRRLCRGDRLWLYIAGDACGKPRRRHQAHLAQLLVVDGWGKRPNRSEFRIRGIKDRCILVIPPMLVDAIFRRRGAARTKHIGIVGQTPLELDEMRTEALLTLLRSRYPDVYAAATQT